MKGTFYLLFLSLACLTAHAQDNPFSSINKQGQILTLSNGQYPEVHINDTLQRIGSVVVNMNTGKIYELLPIDSVYNSFEISPTVTTRWYSIDPLAAKYPDLSPYNFVANSPILFVDADGREIIIRDPNTGETHIYKPDASAPENASEFVKNAYLGLNYLYNLKTPENLNRVDRLVKSSETYEIVKSGISEFSAEYTGNHIIKWDTEHAFEMEKSYGLQSPIVSLAHEIDHGSEFDIQQERYYNENNPDKADQIWSDKVQPFFPDGTYPGDERRLKEENRATRGLETFVAKDLGQGVRPDYSINPIRMFNVDRIFSVEESIKVSPLPVRKVQEIEMEKPEIIINE